MFLRSYFQSSGSQDAAGLPPLSLIAALTLYLTDFLKRTILRENAKNRAFSGGQKLKAAAVYPPGINQGGAPWKPAPG
jgi:hypothetical protein